MSFVRYIFLFLLLIYSPAVVCQDTLDIKQVYIDNDLVYNMDGQRFTGLMQSKRKNGRLRYEEEYSDGVVLSSNVYYNTNEKKIFNKTIYNRYKLWVIVKETYYKKSGDKLSINTFNDDGKKILLEQFENNKVIYSCEFNGKKKHGLELGFADSDGKITYRCKYVNGKKEGEFFCIKEDGEKLVKNYKNGKRIRK